MKTRPSENVRTWKWDGSFRNYFNPLWTTALYALFIPDFISNAVRMCDALEFCILVHRLGPILKSGTSSLHTNVLSYASQPERQCAVWWQFRPIFQPFTIQLCKSKLQSCTVIGWNCWKISGESEFASHWLYGRLKYGNMLMHK